MRMQKTYMLTTKETPVTPEALADNEGGWFFTRLPCNAPVPCFNDWAGQEYAAKEPYNDLRILFLNKQVWRCLVASEYSHPSCSST